jgi:hypothetical protein
LDFQFANLLGKWQMLAEALAVILEHARARNSVEFRCLHDEWHAGRSWTLRAALTGLFYPRRIAFNELQGDRLKHIFERKRLRIYMPIENTKAQLIKLLSQSDTKVIALSGKWGTGKTHLWKIIKSESNDPKVKNALYVSLFGLSNIDQVKRRLLEAAIPESDSYEKIFKPVKKLVKAGVKAGSEHFKALATLNDVNLMLMAPIILEGKVIVLDDIERKNKQLEVDQVLGFIDEYSEQFKARFLLVLNDGELDREAKDPTGGQWSILREKVIDQEIRLTTSAEEAFSIAIKITPSKYAIALEQAVRTCNLTNIRIVLRVISAANQILNLQELEDAILARVIPSIVLFSAIHYRGLVDGPDFKFALDAGNPRWLGLMRNRKEDPTEEDKKNDRWRMLMQQLGITGCDEFEKQLVEFLESGLFDSVEIQKVIDRYKNEKDLLELREAAQNLISRIFWDHRASVADLVSEGGGFIGKAGKLGPVLTSQLCQSISELDGGSAVGEAIVDSWIAEYKNSNQRASSSENIFNNPLHEKIKEEMDLNEAEAQKKMTVVDACTAIITKSGWGTFEEVAMKSASVSDFEDAIRNMTDLDELARFMRRMMDLRLRHHDNDQHFGSATKHFIQACKNIANDENFPRLSKLIKRLFENSTLANQLDTPKINETL